VSADGAGFPAAVTGVFATADITLSNTGDMVIDQSVNTPAIIRLNTGGAVTQLATGVLGAVSLIGPVRMDYEKAVGAVRSAASELSRFAESVYDR